MMMSKIHERLVAIADEASVHHHPMCGAHPSLDDGPCRCAEGTLAALIRALIAIHAPQPSCSINSLGCAEHDPHTNRQLLRRDVYESCPDCVTTPLTVCSCWACDDYPCETVTAVLDALHVSFDTPDLPEVAANPGKQRGGRANRKSDLYLCPVCDAVIEEIAGVDPTCPNGPHVNVACPRHGERTVDLSEVGANADDVTMCPDCRVVGSDGKPLGWQDGRPTEYVDLSAMYRTGTPASDRLVAATRALAATDTFDAEARTSQLAHDHRAMGSAVKADALEKVLAELTALRARIDAARKLHHEGIDSARGELIGDGECVECDQPWPCPTIRGLNGSATGE